MGGDGVYCKLRINQTTPTTHHHPSITHNPIPILCSTKQHIASCVYHQTRNLSCHNELVLHHHHHPIIASSHHHHPPKTLALDFPIRFFALFAFALYICRFLLIIIALAFGFFLVSLSCFVCPDALENRRVLSLNCYFCMT